MADLRDRLVICSVEECLGPCKKWLGSDRVAAQLYQMLGGRLVLETSGHPAGVRDLHRQLDLDTPVLCWEGDWLYSFVSENICSEPALPQKEMKALARDLLEAFPTASLSVLAPSGAIYLPRVNRLAHAYLKNEESPYLLSELDSIPLPWYRVTLFAEPALFTRIRMYLSEKEFQGYRFFQKEMRLQFLPQAIGKEQALKQLWGQLGVLPQNTLWLGCKETPPQVLRLIGIPVAAWGAGGEVRALAQGRLPRHHEGCLGETLYRLCKGENGDEDRGV